MEEIKKKKSHFGNANSYHDNFDTISHNNSKRELDCNLQGHLTAQNSISIERHNEEILNVFCNIIVS